MNDFSLKEVIETSIDVLSEIQDLLTQVQHSEDEVYEKQFINIYETWQSRCNLKSELLDAIFLINCIKKQYDTLQQLQEACSNSMINLNTPDSIEQKRCFKIELTLAVTTYLTITWSLYDKLSNVIGRLLGGDDALKNLLSKENPKLIGSFIGYQKNDRQHENKKIISTIGINNIVSTCFGEKICLSYLLRNCFVHEGGVIEKEQIFTEQTGDNIFNIGETVARKLNEGIAQAYAIKNPTIAKSGNLISQLEQCHYEIDKCFVGLLKFTIGSFRIQVEEFLPLI